MRDICQMIEEIAGHAVECGLHSVGGDFKQRSVDILIAFYKNTVSAPCAC